MIAANIPHPPGFRARRGLNWGCVGLLYTSFYMCRYNLPIANSAISAEFGFSKSQMGWIISTALFAYACGQIINGLLTDRLGGKRAMLIGAAGTIVMNTLFGVASFAGLLAFFVVDPDAAITDRGSNDHVLPIRTYGLRLLLHKQCVKRPARVKQLGLVLRNREIDLQRPQYKQSQPNCC
jgi:MFS family permease